MKVSTNTSTIDQRPTKSTIRYIRIRCSLFFAEPRCVVMSRYASARILALGIMMLAKSTISDSGQPVGDHSSTTPCRIVSESLPVAVVVVKTGRTLAGM